MKFKSTMLFLASALLIGTSLSTVAQNIPEPLVSDTMTETEKPVDPSKVMAIIQGKEITAGQLDFIANEMDPALARLPDQQRRITVLKFYIDMRLLAEAAVKQGVEKSKKFKDRMAIMQDNILQQIYFTNNVLDKISDADIEARYKQEIAVLPKEQEINARHILVKTKEEADALIARLKKGEKFEDLAKEASTDGSAATGGDLGYFSRGQMVKPFEDAAFALKKGKYTTQAVESPFGWHIIKVEDIRDKQPPALEDVKDSLTKLIAQERYATLIEKLRQGATVSYPDKDFAKLMETPAKVPSLPGEVLEEEEE